MKKQFAAILGTLLLSTAGWAQDSLNAKSVWLPEVESMYQSDTATPAWLESSSSELTIVRGLVGSSSQRARAVAIRDVVLPKLFESRPNWGPWERTIAEREIGRWLEHSGCIVARFEQPFHKLVDGERYPAFTREAWQLDLADVKWDSVKRRVDYAVHRAQNRKRLTMSSSIVAVIVLFFGCWFVSSVLDRLTRGYYLGWLRLAAVTTFVVFAGLALHVTRVVLSTL